MVQTGKFDSRHRAQQEIKAGSVRVNGETVYKPSHQVRPVDTVDVRPKISYVSFGGVKLETAIRRFGLDFQGKTVVDVGSSTGGFTDCALSHGAKKVFAVDVGDAQMAPSLREDSRVVLRENINFLNTDLGDFPAVDIATVDVSFTSSLPVVQHAATLFADATLVVLLKPQFEGEKGTHTGVLRRERELFRVVKAYLEKLKDSGHPACAFCEAPRQDDRGNREFFVLIDRKSQKSVETLLKSIEKKEVSACSNT